MSVAEPTELPAGAGVEPIPAAQPYRRPLRKRVMHVVRRAHLYFGLFLLPWAVLYGATGFLFNHPTAFSDSPSVSFGAIELADTPMASPPKPGATAAEVVAALNERAKGSQSYSLIEPEKAKYAREFAFASAKADGQEISILFDVNNPAGTVRSRAAQATAVSKSEEKAPFAISGANPKGASSKGGRGGSKGEREGRGSPKDAAAHANHAPGLALPDPLHDRVKAAAPVVLERTGFAAGEVTVTSVPDLSFLMSDGQKVWRVTYNAMSGSVAGVPADAAQPAEELSTRRFLTRLHTAHGFPGEQNAKWFWAVIVDAMAFVMVFWGVSGVFMWWQLKATRKIGIFILVLSVAAATALGVSMHDVMVAR